MSAKHLTPGEAPRAATRTPSREPRVDRGDAFPSHSESTSRAYRGAREARPRTPPRVTRSTCHSLPAPRHRVSRSRATAPRIAHLFFSPSPPHPNLRPRLPLVLTQCYLNELLASNFDVAKDWCYTGVGVMPNDAAMRDYLRVNDWSYPIVSRSGADADSMSVEVEDVLAMRDMILAYEDPVACIEAMANPDVKIVSLTITEFGYRVPLHKGDFCLIEQALNGMLTDDTEPLIPESEQPTTFGVICAAAALRFTRGLRPFTLMSCDNLPHNGDVCRSRITGAAEELVCGGICATNLDEFIVWLQTQVRYPSTMVDRITPATSPEDIATLPAMFGIEDDWPVMCEPYKHWVIQDDFVDDERPPWEEIGAVLVNDVIPHELMKVRLLNVTHSAMCYAGILAGLDHVHEAVTHEKLRAFLMRVMLDEIGPTLKANAAMSDSPILINGMREYAEMVLNRFENVAVKDQLRRIAMDGSEKFRVQGREVVLEGIALGLPMRGFALYVATWAAFLENEVRAGNQVQDMGGAAVTAAFQEGGSGLPSFLGMEEIFGDLAADDAWKAAVAELHAVVVERGVVAALDIINAEQIAEIPVVAMAR